MTESRLLSRAVDEFARRTRFPIAFGGLRDAAGVTRVTSIVGTRTSSLRGLSVAPERGLGGRAVTELRPRMTGDYATARQITHDYDTYILGEGIGTLIAVPVLVDGRPRGILYGGAWGTWGIGGVSAAPAVRVAEQLGRELAEHDAVERRLAVEAAAEAAGAADRALSSAQREELRASYTELRRISAELGDDALRSRLQEVERRLAALSGTASATAAPADVHLSPRETDVIACAALGSTNAQIADQLGLREGTVKAYLGSAMSKLDASTRHAAVAAARRLGVLP
ncbi:LuxR C-terminal-related transcriptional regulator [Microbacterium karelineae]|uniref:LuxR C-terminal-related transcriptional regulator n=1 Tax=Microbacterium karelineae TaxID=2654283 RepID=UPI0012EA0131|nr:LuxR C-terminal-related transcriptional regulator [Microbacterium karelineae]